MADHEVDASRIFQELGEIKGALKGVTDLINVSHASTNQRIDDLAENVREQTRSLNIRIDDQAKRIDTHEEHLTLLQDKASSKKLVGISSGTSAVVSASVMIIKELLI